MPLARHTNGMKFVFAFLNLRHLRLSASHCFIFRGDFLRPFTQLSYLNIHRMAHVFYAISSYSA